MPATRSRLFQIVTDQATTIYCSNNTSRNQRYNFFMPLGDQGFSKQKITLMTGLAKEINALNDNPKYKDSTEYFNALRALTSATITQIEKLKTSNDNIIKSIKGLENSLRFISDNYDTVTKHFQKDTALGLLYQGILLHQATRLITHPMAINQDPKWTLIESFKRKTLQESKDAAKSALKPRVIANKASILVDSFLTRNRDSYQTTLSGQMLIVGEALGVRTLGRFDAFLQRMKSMFLSQSGCNIESLIREMGFNYNKEKATETIKPTDEKKERQEKKEKKEGVILPSCSS